MHSRGRCLPLVFLFAVSLYSQTKTPPTFKSEVQVVLVDVVVTNEEGEAVNGLERTDFKLEEDGKPQTIVSFEEHRGVQPTKSELPPMPSGVFTNFPRSQSNDSVNVLLLDALNTTVRDQTFVRTQLFKYLQTLPPGARVAVFTLTSRLRMLQEFTSDSSALLNAVGDQKNLKSPLLRSEAESDAIEQFLGLVAGEQVQPQNARNLQEESVDPKQAIKALLAEETAQLADTRIRTTLVAMQQLARYLAGFGGRKNVIWFSGSFPIAIFPNPNLSDPFAVSNNYQKEIHNLANLFTSAQVAIYPIAAEGLTTDSNYQASANRVGSGGTSQLAQQQRQKLQDELDTRYSNHGSMEELAKDTGGQAFYDTNGLSDVLTRVINNGAQYYSLSYSPTNKRTNGRFRKISVGVTKQKYKLFYRRGYYAPTDKHALAEEKSGYDPLLPLLAPGVPNLSQIIYKLRVAPSNPQPALDAARAGGNTNLKGPITRYDLDFAVAPNDVRLELAPDGTRHGSIEIRLIAYDLAGQPINMIGKKVPILLDPKLYAALQRVGLQIHEQIDVPDKGEIFLRTGIYDFNSGNAGTLGIRMRDRNPSTTVSP